MAFMKGNAIAKRKEGFSVLRYLIYFSQVGFTVITPPVLCCFERYGSATGSVGATVW